MGGRPGRTGHAATTVPKRPQREMARGSRLIKAKSSDKQGLGLAPGSCTTFLYCRLSRALLLDCGSLRKKGFIKTAFPMF